MANPYLKNGAGKASRALGPRILIVDDEDLIRWSLRECLSAHGFRVLEAASAAGAMKRFHEGVDLVLLDYLLPDANGLDVTDDIRKASPSCPVVIMTAYGTPELRAQAARRNVLQVVEKPFDVPELVECITVVLSPSRRTARR